MTNLATMPPTLVAYAGLQERGAYLRDNTVLGSMSNSNSSNGIISISVAHAPTTTLRLSILEQMSLHEEEKSERGREGLRLYFRDLMVAQLVLMSTWTQLNIILDYRLLNVLLILICHCIFL